MEKHCIDGVLLCGMLRNGLAELEAHEEEINMLNVFPVPDGDTGSNMRMTLEHGVKTAEPKNSVGEYMKEVSDGMLLGARGNSGVILSQFFKGIYLGLSDAFTADAETLLRAFEKGWRTAYKAVVHPVEGTMLTVMREGTERLAAVLTPDMTEAELPAACGDISYVVLNEKKELAACAIFTERENRLCLTQFYIRPGTTVEGIVLLQTSVQRAVEKYGDDKEAEIPVLSASSLRLMEKLLGTSCKRIPMRTAYYEM